MTNLITCVPLPLLTVIRSRRMGWGHVAHTGEIINAYRISVGKKLKQRDNLETEVEG
jgi:hypothetical protein